MSILSIGFQIIHAKPTIPLNVDCKSLQNRLELLNNFNNAVEVYLNNLTGDTHLNNIICHSLRVLHCINNWGMKFFKDINSYPPTTEEQTKLFLKRVQALEDLSLTTLYIALKKSINSKNQEVLAQLEAMLQELLQNRAKFYIGSEISTISGDLSRTILNSCLKKQYSHEQYKIVNEEFTPKILNVSRNASLALCGSLLALTIATSLLTIATCYIVFPIVIALLVLTILVYSANIKYDLVGNMEILSDSISDSTSPCSIRFANKPNIRLFDKSLQEDLDIIEEQKVNELSEENEIQDGAMIGSNDCSVDEIDDAMRVAKSKLHAELIEVAERTCSV